MSAISLASRLVREARTRAALTQRDLALRARTAQSAVARIELGYTSPALDTIARLLAAAGFELKVELVPTSDRDPLVERYKRDIDRSLLRENLKKSVDDRVNSLTALARFADEARRAGRAVKGVLRDRE